MQLTTQVILALAATVSALDIRIHDESGCGGAAWYVYQGRVSKQMMPYLLHFLLHPRRSIVFD